MKEQQINRSRLFDRLPPPVRSDVFLHGLDAYTLETLRRALARGLVPSGLDFTGDDGSIAILKLGRPQSGKADATSE